jgi:RNA polymerase sigma factor (sigma-70 family)
MASFTEILGNLSFDRANDLSAAGKHGVTPGSGGTAAAPARSQYAPPATTEPEQGLRLLSEAWMEDPAVDSAPGSPGEHARSAEHTDLRSLLWTQLVSRLQAGDPEAMAELYAMFSNGVRFHVCRQLGPEELEDRLHDAFLIVLDSIRAGELRDPRRLMGFIRTVVKRMIATTIDKKVAARRDRVDEEKKQNVCDTRETPESALLFQQQTGIVREVLREMPERDRQILTRFYVDEETPQRICEDMQLTMTQFRLLKSRAKNRFGELGRKKVQKAGLLQVFMRFSGG